MIPKVQAIPGFRHAIVRYRNHGQSGNSGQACEDGDSFPNWSWQTITLFPRKLPMSCLVFSRTSKITSFAAFVDSGASCITWIASRLTKCWIAWPQFAWAIGYERADRKLEQDRFSRILHCSRNTDRSWKEVQRRQTAKQVAGRSTLTLRLRWRWLRQFQTSDKGKRQHSITCCSFPSLTMTWQKVLLAKLNVILHPKITENGDLWKSK